MSASASQPDDEDEFLRAARAKERGVLAEFVAFLAKKKAWWLAPLLVVCLCGALLIYVAVAPPIYSHL